MSASPAPKKAKLDPDYELLYWPGLPGRGEYVRLALEAAGIPYNDVSNSEENGISKVTAIIDQKITTDEDGNPPAFAPPALRVLKSPGKSLLITQTPNILLYLGDHHDLAPKDDTKYHVHEITLTALDLNNEAHDVHHPVGVGLYYEDQKEESLRRAKEFKAERIPKFFGYFNRILQGNEVSEGKYLVGDKLTYADTSVFHVVNGITYAFPNTVKKLKGEGKFKELFQFHDEIEGLDSIREYLKSGRRLDYGMGIFRYYPELDDEE